MKKDIKKNRLFKNCFKKCAVWAAAVLIAAVVWQKPAVSFALNVTPISVEMYSTSGTPVYAAPDVYTPVVIYLDRFINVRVTGITDNGFFQVDLNGTYYIPGPYMVPKVEAEKTEKQKALDDLEDFAKAYRIQLEQMESYSAKFALIDVTGDGIPEIIDAAGKEIYTYYNDHSVMMYYSENPVTFYYSKKDNKLLGKYTWNKNEIWEVYDKDVSLLPWGQFRCISTAASPYRDNAAAITREYTNDEATRADIYNILKKILSL
ncbi:MAG: hypothetical protein J6D08_18670 [Lachnospiraceae bacterium]|nr:hypothetical protein [Lachnospiraceae bacterium]